MNSGITFCHVHLDTLWYKLPCLWIQRIANHKVRLIAIDIIDKRWSMMFMFSMNFISFKLKEIGNTWGKWKYVILLFMFNILRIYIHVDTKHTTMAEIRFRIEEKEPLTHLKLLRSFSKLIIRYWFGEKGYFILHSHK